MDFSAGRGLYPLSLCLEGYAEVYIGRFGKPHRLLSLGQAIAQIRRTPAGAQFVEELGNRDASQVRSTDKSLLQDSSETIKTASIAALAGLDEE